MQDIPVTVWGQGEPALFVHGSGDTNPEFVWANQRPLAQNYQLLIYTRPGYGQRPVQPRKRVEQDAQEIVELLTARGGAHVVGFSYGGSISLIAAARCPELIRSLTVIEPPAFSVARGNPNVENVIEQLRLAYEPERPLTTEEFLVRFMKSLQPDFPDAIELSQNDRKGIEAMRAEPAPWEIEIPLAALAKASFPKLVFSGNWSQAFDAVAGVLARQPGTQLVVCPGNGHCILDTGELFNRQLDSFLRSVTGASSQNRAPPPRPSAPAP